MSSNDLDLVARPRRFERPRARWTLPQLPPAVVTELKRELSVGDTVAQILTARGYTNCAAASDFLYPQLDRLHDPFALAGMRKAVERLQRAIAAREPILIYGDYDVDGTTSVVVLKKAVELLGGIAEFHIPHRLKDGYGMRTEVVEHAAESGVRLIVSVDTGIRASAVVMHANSLGIDVIVTDHHLPETDLPPALAVLNPNRHDCSYPCKDLCGAGVTFKLVQALVAASNLNSARQQALLDSFLKPVAIATVADIVPLTGENRIIVRRGLSGLRSVRNPGLRALLAVAGLDEGDAPSAHQVAFRLAPRINAAGRMATARDVIELFLTTDSERARDIAAQLDALNRERQQVEREIVEFILTQCEQDSAHLEGSALVFSQPDWHLGVLGIVASRLVERFCRPVFVLSTGNASSEGEPYLTGSGRSIPAFHLLEALESMPELFTRFGGHRGAAGLTLPAAELENFRRRFSEFASRCLTEEDCRPEFIVDAFVPFVDLNDKAVEQILELGPFGFGNPMPLLLTLNAEVAGELRIFGNGKHLSIPLRHEGRVLIAKAWNFGDRAERFARGTRLDVLFTLEDDPDSRKRGYPGWTMSIKDVRPAS